MNRLKLWLFALLLIGAAALSLIAATRDLGVRAIEILDGRLAAASARVAASQRALQGEAGAVAALAARDPALIHALASEGRPRRARAADDADEESEAQRAARAAVAAAETELGVSLPQGARFVAAQRSWLEARAEDPAADAATISFLRGALDGKPRRGFVRAGGGLSWGAALPAGAGVLGVFLPVDAAWIGAVAGGAGVDLTVAAPGLPPVSSIPAEAEALARAAAAAPGKALDAGRLAPVAIDAGGVKLGDRQPLLDAAPAHRVMALPLADVKDGALVLSVTTRPLLAPVVELQWLGLLGLGLATVLALLFGLLLTPAAQPSELPAELLSAADRIERGEFEVRAPALAGRLGTVAAALNRAAAAAMAAPLRDAAGPAGSSAPAASATPPHGTLTEPSWALSGRLGAPASAPALPVREPSPAAPQAPACAESPEAAPLPSPPAPLPTLRLDAAALGGSSLEAPAPPPEPAVAEPTASPAALLQAAARVAPAGDTAAEEEHWREVFRDFMRVRAECGEPTQGLTYERLRPKLESNRAALVAKYGCRTVRFQVYVKEGRTALKATPVR